MKKDIYQTIIELLASQETLKNVEKPGMCRVWSDMALRAIIRFLAQSDEQMTAEAREVDLELCYSHTFIKLMAEGSRPFIIDVIGTSEFSPFVGYEDEAPDHLQNSHYDMLNYYL